MPGGEAEFLRVPFGNFLPIKVPDGPPDDRFVFLLDVLPTAWQGVAYADVPDGGSLVVLGLGPIGDMATRIAQHRGYRVIGVDLGPERLARVGARGPRCSISATMTICPGAIREMTDGRGPDAPSRRRDGGSWLSDRAIEIVRRGGTISLSGVYGGAADPMPTLQLFDKQIQVRQGQANVKAWVDDILALLTDEDPLGVDTFATHHLPLTDAPEAYEHFQKKEQGMIKVVFNP